MVLINPDEFHNDPKNAEISARLKLKPPKRVLHFSDGVLEEYSDDEVDMTPKENNEKALIDPSTLTWGPWLWYKAWLAGNSTLAMIDYIGESLASFLGITTPRYYFELEEYKKNQEFLEHERDQERGWSRPSDLGGIPLRDMPVTQQQQQPLQA